MKVKFDHMAMPVSDPKVSRDWYVKNFGFEVECENAGVIAIKDDADFTIFLYQQGFKSFNLGYAAAIGMVLFVIIFARAACMSSPSVDSLGSCACDSGIVPAHRAKLATATTKCLIMISRPSIDRFFT